MKSHTSENSVAIPLRSWPLFLVGVLLFVLGPIAYVVHMNWSLVVPWYLPGLSTLGVVLMAASVWQRRGILRSVGLALFVLLCGLQWTFFLVLTRTPPYTGPAQVGNKLPVFHATFADGTAFTNSDLDGDKRRVLLFYRGHW